MNRLLLLGLNHTSAPLAARISAITGAFPACTAPETRHSARLSARNARNRSSSSSVGSIPLTALRRF